MNEKKIKYIKYIKLLKVVNSCCGVVIALTFVLVAGSFVLPDVDGIIKRAIIILIFCGVVLVLSMSIKEYFRKKIKQNKNPELIINPVKSIYKHKQSLENYKRNNKKYTLQGLKDGEV